MCSNGQSKILMAIERGNQTNMKYIIILGDGMPDYPLEELGGKTPLEYAQTPNIDKLARCGEMGLAKTVPQGLPPGSDVANLSVMGYDPSRYYTGRSPLEAAGMGIEMGSTDLAIRCNLVTLSEDEPYSGKTMRDYSAGDIDSPQGAVLIDEIARLLGNDTLKFYPGVGYRHLLIWKNGPPSDLFRLTPPHDISGQKITAFLPNGEKGPDLLRLMEKSYVFLSEHQLNMDRRKKGFAPANSLWLWGQGKKPHLDSFKEKYGIDGAVISAVDLLKGIGVCASLEVIEVPGATGTINTNYAGKVLAALESLQKGMDFIFIHIEAPDEAGHRGELGTKIEAIETIDAKVVGEMLKGLDDFSDYKLLVMADHPTPLALRTHTHEPVPFCLYRKNDLLHSPDLTFSEKTAAKGPYFNPAWRLMDYFLQR